jgi:nitrate/TMAO reductase-like tetraheme cytochrome c subunit
MRKFLNIITGNPLSLMGATLAATSAALIVILIVAGIGGGHDNPYVGILSFIALPAVFVTGLALIPLGLWRDRRRQRRAAAGDTSAFPVIDLNVNKTRRIVMTVVVVTIVNLMILAGATYRAVEYMDSTEFCGLVCHSVMQPEYTAFSRSPHARVTCASCHIGPGADWFVKSKLSGAWQVVSVNLDLYERPIPTPIHNLRPARETCEQCHWPSKFVGDRLRVRTHYLDDEASTEVKTVVLLRVGGLQGRKSHGIHWHVDPANQVRYRSDESREIIGEVELTLPTGTVKTYSLDGVAEDEITGDWRTMDCVDCHNRPTHIYRVPEQEVDEAIENGSIPRSLPYVRRESVRALRGDYASQDEARERIAAEVSDFYDQNHPEIALARGAEIEQVGRTLGDLYSYNVFPSMNIDWGTYPDHLGHVNFPGCFRCHDDEHATADGEVISQDCDTCHTLLAMEEKDPEVLQVLKP